jgi:aldose 1-epimerase
VEFEAGYAFGQVFAPTDQEFVCLEPMTAPTNALVSGQGPVAAPGDEFRAVYTIAVEEG